MSENAVRIALYRNLLRAVNAFDRQSVPLLGLASSLRNTSSSSAYIAMQQVPSGYVPHLDARSALRDAFRSPATAGADDAGFQVGVEVEAMPRRANIHWNHDACSRTSAPVSADMHEESSACMHVDA